MSEEEKPGALPDPQEPEAVLRRDEAAELRAGQRTRGLASDLAEDVARALFLNIKKLPKRQRNWALTYDAYLGLAQAVVSLLQLSGWRFDRRPRRSSHDVG